jgi:hypothetical protein
MTWSSSLLTVADTMLRSIESGEDSHDGRCFNGTIVHLMRRSQRTHSRRMCPDSNSTNDYLKDGEHKLWTWAIRATPDSRSILEHDDWRSWSSSPRNARHRLSKAYIPNSSGELEWRGLVSVASSGYRPEPAQCFGFACSPGPVPATLDPPSRRRLLAESLLLNDPTSHPTSGRAIEYDKRRMLSTRLRRLDSTLLH